MAKEEDSLSSSCPLPQSSSLAARSLATEGGGREGRRGERTETWPLLLPKCAVTSNPRWLPPSDKRGAASQMREWERRVTTTTTTTTTTTSLAPSRTPVQKKRRGGGITTTTNVAALSHEKGFLYRSRKDTITQYVSVETLYCTVVRYTILSFRKPSHKHTQPPSVVCKMIVQLECAHVAYTFCTFGADL